MFKDFFKSFADCFRALGFVFENRMAHYFIYPVLITIVLSIGLVAGIEAFAAWVTGLASESLGISVQPTEDESWWQTGWRWLQEAADFSIKNVLGLAIQAIFYFFVFPKMIKYVVLIIMSPVMSLVSETAEGRLIGREYPFEWAQFIKDILRGIRIAVRNFLIEFGIIIGVWIVNIIITSFLPFLAIITVPAGTLFTFFIGAYFYGFATMDYTNERRRLNVRESVQFIRSNKGIALGNGSLFSLMMLVPYLGTYLGPIFGTIMCTVGSVLSIHDKVNLERDDFYLKQTPGDQVQTTEEP